MLPRSLPPGKDQACKTFNLRHECLQKLLAYENSSNGNCFTAIILTLRTEPAAVCVAEIDSLVVGWGHVQGRYSIESVPFAEIGGLVVDEHHRGAGIGKKIMSECEKWARMNGFNKIRVRSSGKREAAHRFYIAIGYNEKKWQKVFDKSL